jgi:CHASE3 domain sensor protein
MSREWDDLDPTSFRGSLALAAAALPAAIDQTARLVADNPQQQQNIAGLRRVVSDKLSEPHTTIDEQKAGRADAVRAIVNSESGAQMIDLMLPEWGARRIACWQSAIMPRSW